MEKRDGEERWRRDMKKRDEERKKRRLERRKGKGNSLSLFLS